MEKFELNLKERNIPKERLLEDLKKVAHSVNEENITAAVYAQKGKFGVNTFLRRFGSWNKALEAAGLKVMYLQNIPEEALFENLTNVWQRLGRQPVGKDLDKDKRWSQHSLGTYEKRFGSWNKALKAFIAYIDNSSEPKKIMIEKPIEGKRNSARTSRKINWWLRATVLIRDNCICKMCGASPAKNSSVVLHVDHINPWYKGGETILENLQTLCSVCNVGKSDEIF